MRPTPSQARLLKALADRPTDLLCIWFRTLRFVPREAKGDWSKGEDIKAKRQVAMTCARFGWLERQSITARYDEGYFALTDLGRRVIAGLPPSAFVSHNGKPKASVKGQAARVLRALAARHDPARGWVFFLEAPAGAGGQSVDAWAMNVYASQANRRVGYEVKVSRSDFKSEMRQPDKTARSAHFCTQFYFDSPVGVIQPRDVPDPYGLVVVRPNGSSRIVKPSRIVDARPAAWSFLGMMLRRAMEVA